MATLMVPCSVRVHCPGDLGQVPGTFSHQLKFTRIGMHAEYNGPMRLMKCMKNDALSRVIFPTRGFQLKVKAQCEQKEKGIFFSRAHF